MGAIKVEKFLGIAPKLASENLPDNAAQVAKNCKIYSGDLIPYKEPLLEVTLTKAGVIESVYPMDDGAGGKKWLHWTDDVDVVRTMTDGATDQRIYYTGDTSYPFGPQATDYTLATSADSYPKAAYKLGLPPPNSGISNLFEYSEQADNAAWTKAGTTVTANSAVAPNGATTMDSVLETATTATHSISQAETVTAGTYVMSGYFKPLGRDWIRLGNATQFAWFNITTGVVGTQTGCTGTIASAGGTTYRCSISVALTGAAHTFYVYTQTADAQTGTFLGDITKGVYAWGLQLELGSAAGAYTATPAVTFSATASFPTAITGITRSGQTATVNLVAHGKVTGDIIFVSGANQTEYNISTAITRIDADNFSYIVAGAPATPATGTLVFASGDTVAKARYYVYTWVTDWGWESKPSSPCAILTAMDGQTVSIAGLPTAYPVGYPNVTKLRLYRTVTGSSGTAYYQVLEHTLSATATDSDAVAEASLITPLASQNYAEPPVDLAGLVSMPNGILAGFSGNYVYFSEPYKPWAWPTSYRKAMDFTVVGLAATGTTLVVCTDSKPAYITGNTSSAMSVSRPDLHYPCVSKRSIVNMGWGILYASYDGLVQVSAGLGNKLATKMINYRDEWLTLSPGSIIASQHADKYIATHPTGGFAFERDDQTGGNMITLDTRFSGAYHHASESALYYVDVLSVSGSSKVYKFDYQSGSNLGMDWMSKTIVLPRALNLGAAMISADYTGYAQSAVDAALATYNADATAANADGELNATEANVYDLNGDGGQTLPVIDGIVLFQWYVGKQLIYQTYVTDANPFTLPTGYRSATYEFRMQAKIRIRYVEIGETALDLETV